MPVSNNSQILIFLSCALGGMIIAFIYDLFRIKRKAIKTKGISIYLEDLVYWIIVAFVMFGVIYRSNDGEMRGYIFIATILGVIIYISFLSRFVTGLLMFVLRILYKIGRTIWIIVSFPFKIIYRILRIPGIRILRLIRKLSSNARRIGRQKIDRAMLIRKRMRNKRKKI